MSTELSNTCFFSNLGIYLKIHKPFQISSTDLYAELFFPPLKLEGTSKSCLRINGYIHSTFEIALGYEDLKKKYMEIIMFRRKILPTYSNTTFNWFTTLSNQLSNSQEFVISLRSMSHGYYLGNLAVITKLDLTQGICPEEGNHYVLPR